VGGPARAHDPAACAGVIYLFLRELRDSIVLLTSIFVVVGIDFYQQRKTEHALEALRDLSSPRAMVVRGGQQRHIEGRELVRGYYAFARP
jgi:Ca2+-transporting ATPase